MLVAYVDILLEKKMSPFKRKDPTGPAIGNSSGDDKRTTKSRGEWNCKCKDYKCTCKGTGAMKGRTKEFEIDSGKKGEYNARYKQHGPYKRWRSKVRAERDK